MRYLKTYSIFESSLSSGKFSEDMINDIKDILLELSDEDIDVSNIKEINYNPPLVDGKIEALNIDIHSNSFFTWDDIKDAILRLEEYLWRFGSGYRFDVEVTRDDDWMSLSRFIDVYGGEEFTKPGISLLIYSEEDYNKLEQDELEDLSESKWGAVGDTQDIQHHYSIYEFFEDLKSMQWGYKTKDTSDLKKWSEHFIGRGYFDKISKSVDSIFNSLSKVDLDYVGDRMLEVWDELPYEKDKKIYLAVAYGDYEKYDKDNYHKFNGLIHVGDKNDRNRKIDIIIHIIKDIIYPTIFIGSPSIPLRRTNDQIYVTDEEWNCKNFNIDNYDIEPNKEYENDDSGFNFRRRNTTTIYPSDFNKLKLYHADKVIEMHKPCLVMDIGGYSESHLTGKISLSKLEPLLDDVLETILPELDYEDIIWDKARGRRQFSDDEFYDYTLKILLK
jgi:hypothetical protein